MSSLTAKDDPEFRDALRVLKGGGFDASAPLFGVGTERTVIRPRIIEWYDQGFFSDQPQALAEALSCACFLGQTSVAEYLLDHGVAPTVGDGTGMNAYHWAVNRGKLETVRLLIRRNAPLEVRNMHGTTVLGTAVWSIINEPWWPDQLQIIEELLAAGARVKEAGYPTGHEQVDAVLRRHGAS
ncbi:MAG TPA: ankyrin repeat domain-containing protein [Gemmataceae bacterium]|nr:ankyrin repeat domain-containing protein [Gemmataceae bacterium]